VEALDPPAQALLVVVVAAVVAQPLLPAVPVVEEAQRVLPRHRAGILAPAVAEVLEITLLETHLLLGLPLVLVKAVLLNRS
jgi:hypothetical protein